MIVKFFGGFAHSGPKKKDPATTTTTTTTTTPAPERSECIDHVSFETCNVEFKTCLLTEDHEVCRGRMCQCAAESLIDSSRTECRNIIDRSCMSSPVFDGSNSAFNGSDSVFDGGNSVFLQEVNYFGHTMTVVAACGATVLTFCVLGLVLVFVYRYMTKKSMPSSPSRTPLCTAASSDLTLIFVSSFPLHPDA